MNGSELRARQAPIKERYRTDPEAALTVARAEGRLGGGVTCTVEGWAGETVAGLHPATGGGGRHACSADMLLEALVACAGVTIQSVATVLGVELGETRVRAEGTWDARGTLGVSRNVPVGLTGITLVFELDSGLDPATAGKLVDLTERYCVIYQTLRGGVPISVRRTGGGEPPPPARGS